MVARKIIPFFRPLYGAMGSFATLLIAGLGRLRASVYCLVFFLISQGFPISCIDRLARGGDYILLAADTYRLDKYGLLSGLNALHNVALDLQVWLAEAIWMYIRMNE